jgi:hypothetical protein
MTRIRRINLRAHHVAALVAVTAVLLAPVSAHANPLLSGYGGPGQGSQVLLGSALIKGPGGGGGSGGSRSGSAGATAQPSDQAAAGSSTAEGSSGRGRAATGGNAVVGSGRLLPVHLAASASTDPLGLSATDLTFVALALCVLIATAILLGRLSGDDRKGLGS